MSTERRFALPFAAGLTLAGSLALWRGHAAAAIVLYSVAGFHALAAAFAPRLLGPSKLVVEGIVKAIGLVIGKTVLLAFYWLIFTPFALAVRLAGKDSLKTRAPRWLELSDAENAPRNLHRLF